MDNARINNHIGINRMNLPYLDDTEMKVKYILDVWASWMRVDDKNHLGFTQCMIYYTATGYGSLDDAELRDNKNKAVTAQAIYEGLSLPQKLAINHFHLSAVWHPQRYKIEDAYASAIEAMTKGLRRRGIV